MYIMISSVDIVSAFGFVHQSGSMMLLARGIFDLETFKWNYAIFYPLTSLSYRTSVFFNVVLTVCRTVSIVRPFYIIKKKVVIAACIVYPTIWGVIVAFDVYKMCFSDISIDQFFGTLKMPMSGSFLAFLFYEHTDITLYFVIVFCVAVTPFLFPCLIVLITCIIQIVSLCKSNLSTNTDNQRRVTVTILMISVLFFICNYVYSIFLSFYLTVYISESDNAAVWCLVVFLTIFPLLNAALSPVIIICRSSGLRKEFVTMVEKTRERYNKAQTGISQIWSEARSGHGRASVSVDTAVVAETVMVWTLL